MFDCNCVWIVYIFGRQAYAAYMKGNLLLEREDDWDVALKNFKNARYDLICMRSFVWFAPGHLARKQVAICV